MDTLPNPKWDLIPVTLMLTPFCPGKSHLGRSSMSECNQITKENRGLNGSENLGFTFCYIVLLSEAFS